MMNKNMEDINIKDLKELFPQHEIVVSDMDIDKETLNKYSKIKKRI